jgi:hypothetical protein
MRCKGTAGTVLFDGAAPAAVYDAHVAAAGRWWELNDNPDYYIAVAEGEVHKAAHVAPAEPYCGCVPCCVQHTIAAHVCVNSHSRSSSSSRHENALKRQKVSIASRLALLQTVLRSPAKGHEGSCAQLLNSCSV